MEGRVAIAEESLNSKPKVRTIRLESPVRVVPLIREPVITISPLVNRFIEGYIGKD